MSKAKDLTGQTFGRLTVLRYEKKGEGKQSRRFCLCQCSCGNERLIRPSRLTDGSRKSCGCQKKESPKSEADITGKRINMLTAVSRAENRGRYVYWLFKCDCGKTKEIRIGTFLRGEVQSCGCYKPNRLNIKGKTYNALTAIKDTGKRDKIQNAIWSFSCECGNQIEATAAQVVRGQVKCCGCRYRTADGKSRTFAYSSWRAMHARCRDKENPYYGGKDISVCERWQSFPNFLEDMGDRPEGYSIERIDNKKGYSPDNCEWIQLSDQALNTSRTTKIDYQDKSLSLREWEEVTGIPRGRIYWRYREGWALEDVFSTERYPDNFSYRTELGTTK